MQGKSLHTFSDHLCSKSRAATRRLQESHLRQQHGMNNAQRKEANCYLEPFWDQPHCKKGINGHRPIICGIEGPNYTLNLNWKERNIHTCWISVGVTAFCFFLGTIPTNRNATGCLFWCAYFANYLALLSLENLLARWAVCSFFLLQSSLLWLMHRLCAPVLRTATGAWWANSCVYTTSPDSFNAQEAGTCGTNPSFPLHLLVKFSFPSTCSCGVATSTGYSFFAATISYKAIPHT